MLANHYPHRSMRQAHIPLTLSRCGRGFREGCQRIVVAKQAPALGTGSEGKDVPELKSGVAHTRWTKTIAMLMFMGPALILPLSDPLMSLIDAVSLGRVRAPATATSTQHSPRIPSDLGPNIITLIPMEP